MSKIESTIELLLHEGRGANLVLPFSIGFVFFCKIRGC